MTLLIKNKRTWLFVTLLLASAPLSADIFIDNNLSFGTVAVIGNDLVSSISVDLNDGQTYATNKIRILVPGQRGQFTLLNFPPNTLLNISADFLAPKSNTGSEFSEQFILSQLTTDPTVTVDENGMATIYLGGTLSTTGNGNNHFIDTTYKGTHNIVISY